VFGIYLLKSNREKAKSLLASPFTLLLLMGLPTIRNTALAFFVLIPFSSQFNLLVSEENYAQNLRQKLNVIIVAVVALVMVAFLPSIKPLIKQFLPANKESVFDNSAPFLLASYLNQTPDNDPVFNDLEYGSFLILLQKHPIFIDTRNIIYGNEHFAEYLKVTSAESSWPLILNKYKITYILLNKSLSKKLIEQVNDSLDWEFVKEDINAVLYRKRNLKKSLGLSFYRFRPFLK
jgi:hypothetical protein